MMQNRWLSFGCIAVLAVLAITVRIGAKTQAISAVPTFEVASVKPNPNVKAVSSKVANPGGLVYLFVTLSDCIQAAYGVNDEQISGPDWIRSEHYDIQGKAEGNPNSDQLMAMLQTLLSERFQLKMHREQKELPVYALTVAKGESRLVRHTGDDAMKVQFVGGRILLQSASTAEFVKFLKSFPLDRPIRDNTGLTGKFDFSLILGSPEMDAGTLKRTLARGDAGIISDALAPLGLKLEPQKALTDAVIVDHVERPENQN